MTVESSIEIQLFSTLGVTIGGVEIVLPPSRKTRALLAYLVVTEKRMRRDQLCSLLWELPDDPRGALRWSISKLRRLLEQDGRSVVISDREHVRIDTSYVATDLARLAETVVADHIAPELAEAVWQETSHPLLADCELPNQPDFMHWLEEQRQLACEMRARLAKRMTLDLASDPAKATMWSKRLSAGMPHDHISRSGDKSVSEVPVDQSDGSAKIPSQTIRFVKAKDGTSLAWASTGDNAAPPLVKAANWLNHLELDWGAPIWSPLFRELSSRHRFVRYDERGCGLSDWNVPSIDFESFVTDLELVVDAACLDRFPLLGISQGAAVSIEYAARHPDRVSHLILVGGYPVGWRATADEQEVREREAVIVLTEAGWGRENPAYRNMFSQTFMPGANNAEMAWFDEFQRLTTSSANAARFLEAFSSLDVRHRLADVKAPTLVAHSLHEKRIPAETGRSLAATIPNARFVGLDSPNHLILGREPAAQTLLDAIEEFLAT